LPLLPRLPYTTLFRSRKWACASAKPSMYKPAALCITEYPGQLAAVQLSNVIVPVHPLIIPPATADSFGAAEPGGRRLRQGLWTRSEEHTSELQSRFDL